MQKKLITLSVLSASVLLLAGCMWKSSLPPVISQTTAVTTPTNNATPTYVFSSNESWSIVYSWDCTSSTTDAVSGENTIVFNKLTDWDHANCTIQVNNGSDISNTLSIPSFTIDTVAPTATVSYNPSTSTSKEVIATLKGTGKSITVQNNSWSMSYTFTWNGSFTFDFIDSVGNTWTTTATVTWIKTATSAIAPSSALSTTGTKK